MNRQNLPDRLIRNPARFLLGFACVGSLLTFVPTSAATDPATPAVTDASKSQSNRQGTWLTPDDGKFSPVAIDDLPAIVRDVLSPDDRVVKAFSVSADLTAWVLHSADRPTDAAILYTMNDDSFLLHGRVFRMDKADGSEELTELTARYIAHYKPVVDVEGQWAQITSSHWLRDGAPDDKATRIIYGFFDANCIFCHYAWLAFEPYMQQGLQIRWIPVAVIGETSAVKAAALYGAQDASAAMRAGHTNWESGGFEQADHVSADVQDRLDAHLTLMRKVGAGGTPAFLWKDASGKVQIAHGMPRLSKIAEMAGMDRIETEDPRLQRFQ